MVKKKKTNLRQADRDNSGILPSTTSERTHVYQDSTGYK